LIGQKLKGFGDDFDLDWRRAVKLFSALKVIGLLLRRLKSLGACSSLP
jgi:hypothetical protein